MCGSTGAPVASGIDPAQYGSATWRSCGSATSCSTPPGSTSPPSSACRRCCSCRPHTCGKRSSGARAGPGWKRLGRTVGEAPPLRRPTSSRAAPSSSPNRRCALGAGAGSIIVTPTGVDLDALRPRRGSRAPVRERLGLRRPVRRRLGRQLPAASTRSTRRSTRSRESRTRRSCSSVTDPNGRGSKRSRRAGRRDRVHRHGPAPRLAGTWPRWMSRSCSRAATNVFHYSPLKLAEYLAAGRGGRRAGRPADRPRGSPTASTPARAAGGRGRAAPAPVRLHDEPETRARLAAAARDAAERFSWDDVDLA